MFFCSSKFFFVITSLFMVWSCSFLFQNYCFFTRLSEIYSFITILSVFYFTLFLFLYCHSVLPKRNHTGKSWATWCNYRRRWSRNYMNLEKNMRNIFGHANFAAAVNHCFAVSLLPMHYSVWEMSTLPALIVGVSTRQVKVQVYVWSLENTVDGATFMGTNFHGFN